MKEIDIQQSKLLLQMAQNEDLAAQLFDMNEKLLKLESKEKSLKKTNHGLSLKNQHLEKTLEQLKEKRGGMIERSTKDKDELIKSLQDKIKSLNKEMLDYKGTKH